MLPVKLSGTSILNRKSLAITGLVLLSPVVLIFDLLTNQLVLKNLSGPPAVIAGSSIYLGIIFLFSAAMWWLKAKSNLATTFLFWFIICAVIMMFLIASGIILIPMHCVETYITHGDSPLGPIYMEAGCALADYPWETAFWSDLFQGKVIEWERPRILSFLWDELVLDLIQEWSR